MHIINVGDAPVLHVTLGEVVVRAIVLHKHLLERGIVDVAARLEEVDGVLRADVVAGDGGVTVEPEGVEHGASVGIGPYAGKVMGTVAGVSRETIFDDLGNGRSTLALGA